MLKLLANTRTLIFGICPLLNSSESTGSDFEE